MEILIQAAAAVIVFAMLLASRSRREEALGAVPVGAKGERRRRRSRS